MGPVSLYRTWRPRTFADLVGQDAVVRTLTTALETGKLAHAYLFSGPRGSGKTSAAKILARCIDCVNGPTATPDNTCEACEAILNGTALDVLEIDAASNRGIDEIRALREAVKFAPSTMRYKVYIVDEAHMLTSEGANAFLKTLEEPPPHAIFILATTAPEALPPTILSRCQRYAFRRIAIPVMIERMRSIAQSEKIAIDEAALAAIAYRADGGLRDALTMLEQVAAFASGAPIDAATVDAAFGHDRPRARALAVARRCSKAMQRRACGSIDEASDGGADMVGLARNLIAEFRHLLVARINPDLLERDLSEDDAAAARDGRSDAASEDRACAAPVRARRSARRAPAAIRVSSSSPPCCASSCGRGPDARRARRPRRRARRVDGTAPPTRRPPRRAGAERRPGRKPEPAAAPSRSPAPLGAPGPLTAHEGPLAVAERPDAGRRREDLALRHIGPRR